MERRFEVRYRELMDDAKLRPEAYQGMLPRLEAFVQPFFQCLPTAAQQRHSADYLKGLLSNLERKTMEPIAYFHEQDRQSLQKFVGQAPWNHRPMILELVSQVGKQLGTANGVLVFDPSGFPKRGLESVGVARQWCGRLGKMDNCQVGIYMAYVSEEEHALVDFRLYLPRKWSHDRVRRNKCHVPKGTKFRTRHALILEMLQEHGPRLPHAWIAGDDELGKNAEFRGELRDLEEQYLLAVPSNTLVRDLDVEPPPHLGKGPPPKVPYTQVKNWAANLPEETWAEIDVRDGEKGPLQVQAVKVRVQTKKKNRNGPEETLVVCREKQGDGKWKLDYFLSNASVSTPLKEFARVIKAEHRIEECLQRAKGEAGLADYEVRTWEGWHHHQTLSLLASWFLTQEKRRGEKIIPQYHRSSSTPDHRAMVA